ncbi:MAG: hypothetical protein ACR2N6_05020 [Miltoncostaeaceae bacterium]
MRFWRVLAALVAVQVAINVGGIIARATGDNFPPLWNLDAEANIPVWWSAGLLLAVSGLAAGLAWADAQRSRTPLWILAAAVLLLLSLDEVAGLHERLGDAITADNGNVRQWVLVLGPVLLVVVAVLARLLGALTREERLLAVAAVGLYVLALAVEALSIWDDDAREYIAVGIEENAEMLASALGATALLSALARRVRVSRVSVD